MTGFKLTGLQKKFANQTVLDGIDLHIEPGSFVSIVGPSGSGKSTLLRLFAELEKPTAGQIDFSSPATRSSFVFQEANLLDWRNVFENVRLPFEIDSFLKKQYTSQQIAEKVNASLHLVQLEKIQNKFPFELSGGMKMRTSIARALVSEPQCLLMDEPFAALDDNTRFALQMSLREIAQQKKLTVFFVTHNIAEAVFISDRIVQIKESRLGLDQTVQLPKTRDHALRMDNRYTEVLRKIYAELL